MRSVAFSTFFKSESLFFALLSPLSNSSKFEAIPNTKKLCMVKPPIFTALTPVEPRATTCLPLFL